MEWSIKEMPRMPKYRMQRARPLTRTEIKSLLENTRGSRYRLMFSVIYGSGLRVSEACALKVSDLDFKNSKLYIRNTKGGRHRESVLSKNVTVELKEYIASRRPGLWLFPSVRNEYETDLLFPEQKNGKPISARSVQREFWLTKNKLGISGTVSVHSLRHSFATHLIEYGMSLFSLQRLLGHQTVGTTIGYLQSIEYPVMPDFSPLDRLP